MRGILIIVSICFSCLAFSQQVYDHSQFMLNSFNINPAVAGSKTNTLSNQLSFRRQWAGFENAPTTAILSSHGDLARWNSAIGGILLADVTGPTRRTGVQLAYAYHVELNNNATLSLGISGMALQNRIDFSELVFDDMQDQVILSNDATTFGFDFNAGFAVFGDNYTIGFASLQLSEFRNKFEENALAAALEYKRHLVIHGHYQFKISDQFDLEPSGLFKYVYGAPTQFNIGLRGIIKNTFWIGFAYRTDDAIAGLVGVTIKDRLHIGYSYDYAVTPLNTVSNGSHEVTVGFDINLRQNR